MSRSCATDDGEHLKTRDSRNLTRGAARPSQLLARLYPKVICVLSGALLLCVGQAVWSLFKGHPAAKSPAIQSDLKPWGRLIATPLRLEKPTEMLPELTEPLPPTRWHFADRTREETVAFLDTCHLTAEQRQELIASNVLVTAKNGCWITPPAETVLSLSRPSREALYAELARSPDNVAYRFPFRIRQAMGDDWFTEVGLPLERVQLIQKLTYRRGNALCFADTEIAHRLLGGAEFKALIRALYSSDTLLLRLRVEPGDPVDTIAGYWARGWQKISARALMKSLANAGGGEIDVVDLLPPLPRTWLYTFPTASVRGESAADCFSTSLNFFQQSAEKSFLQPAVRNETFRRQYHVTPRAERFGDIIVFADASGATLHACVYVAEDIVFTKNGAQNTHPWVFMHLDSVRALYSESDETKTHVFRLRES
jgi:hypothetical protein